MYLYNLTLQKATAITHCITGNFSGQKVRDMAYPPYFTSHTPYHTKYSPSMLAYYLKPAQNSSQNLYNHNHSAYTDILLQKIEIVVSRGKILELLVPDESAKLQVVLSVEIFGVIRSLAPFRLTGNILRSVVPLN